jgi:hypothetical protein
MKTTLLIIIILLLLFGCGGAQKKAPLYAPIGSETLFSYVRHTEHSYSVTGLSTGAIDSAIKDWNDAVGREFISRKPGGFPIVIQWVPVLVEMLDEPLANAYAQRYLDHCDVFMKEIDNNARYGYDERMVVAHELGHCIGFDHSNNEKSLMHKPIYQDSITTEAVRIINLGGGI